MGSPRRASSWWGLWATFVASGCVAFWLYRSFFVQSPVSPPDVERAGLTLQVRAESACSQRDAGGCQPAESVLPGARVRVFRVRGEAVELTQSLTTDSTGSAALNAVADRRWLLVDAPGQARVSRSIASSPASSLLELRLPAEKAFAARVTDPEGAPIRGAELLLSAGDVLPVAATSDSDGLAVFTGASAPLRHLQVTAPGYLAVSLQPKGARMPIVLRSSRGLEVRVRDARGRPQPAAQVWVVGADLWPARRVTAGPDGVATLRGLPPGSYDVRARHGRQLSPVAFATPLPEREALGLDLVLEEGRHVQINVVEATGSRPPIPEADVVLVEGGLSPFPLEGRTDARGRVQLGPIGWHVPASLSVRADGFVFRGGLALDERSGREPSEMTVELVRGGRLRGRVLDQLGWAVAGASLEVVGSDLDGHPISHRPNFGLVKRGFFEQALPGPMPLAPRGELGVAPLPVPGSSMPPPLDASAWRTALDGRFALEGLPPGRLRVLVRHPDFAPRLSATVTVPPGGEAELVIDLEASAALEGRVLDAAGQGLEGARVDVVARSGTGYQSATSRAGGHFAFAALARDVDVFVARPERSQHFVLRRSLELEAGERRRLDLTLPEERAAILVRVVDPSDFPIERALVSLLSVDPALPHRASQRTDAAGEARLPDALGLSVRLRVVAPGFRHVDEPLQAAPAEIHVALEPGVAVVGRVTQVRGRQVVSGARVVLESTAGRWSTESDDAGAYALEGVPTGPLRLSVSHPELADWAGSVRVESTTRSGRPFELPVVELLRSASVGGRVIGADGSPIAGARVVSGLAPALLPLGPNPRGLVETDAYGRFELTRLSPGSVSLSAYSAEHGRGRVTLELAEGEQFDEITIRLAGGPNDIDTEGRANVAVTLAERPVDAGGPVVVVAGVPRASLAFRAGVRPGDVLESVDGQSALGDLRRARALLAGPDGSDVVLGLVRAGRFRSIRLSREPVRR